LKNIEIYDNIVPFTERTTFYTFAQNSLYKIGWADRDEYEKKPFPCLHCLFSPDDLIKMNILPFVEKIFKKSKFKKYFPGNTIDKAVLNLSKPGDIHYNHIHLDRIGILYYINLDWKPEWYGETLFWDKDEKEIIHTSPYTPGRFIIFDAEKIPHTLRPQSSIGPAYRFTLSIFLKK
tara:strand:- start:55 stop:585 length:531 start_codon:yes stop_codon:yes gene_type:complete